MRLGKRTMVDMAVEEQRADGATASPEFDAWNPGLESTIPRALRPLATLYRPENANISYREAEDLSEFCGLDPAELASFKTERLIVHELLVRVTADLSVPDGPSYEELGINLRGMVDTILRKYALSQLEAIRRVHDQVAEDARAWIDRELEPLFEQKPATAQQPEKKSFFARLLGGGGKDAPPAPSLSREEREIAAVESWKSRLGAANDPFELACLKALARVAGAIVGKQGKLVGDRTLLCDVATRMVCNAYGSEQIGKALEPLIDQAVKGENYKRLPVQEKPVIMNVKGASAAGKSTTRPMQMELSQRIGVPWDDFAVISPDYWRKYMLDYDSLGEHAKYAAMLTGQELEIVDKKLDRHMAQKAADHRMSHLLIDRFRFDSFWHGKKRAADSKLLTRFGDLVFLFFVITAPAATVDRAWQRGLKTGRFKAVDDLLYHNVEAFTGMPELFFSWALSEEKHIHYEFLDNNVPEGEQPRTVAFGWNGTMTILDVKVMLDVARYRKVNVEATRPEDVLDPSDMAPQQNTAFLERCTELVPVVRFADYRTGYVYGRMEEGRWTAQDRDYADENIDDTDWQEGLRAIGWYDDGDEESPIIEQPDQEQEKIYTLGLWAPNS